MAETRSTIKVLFILYFVSDPESEPESEPIKNPESESESEQPHHDSAPLLHMLTAPKMSSAISCAHLGTIRHWPTPSMCYFVFRFGDNFILNLNSLVGFVGRYRQLARAGQ